MLTNTAARSLGMVKRYMGKHLTCVLCIHLQLLHLKMPWYWLCILSGSFAAKPTVTPINHLANMPDSLKPIRCTHVLHTICCLSCKDTMLEAQVRSAPLKCFWAIVGYDRAFLTRCFLHVGQSNGFNICLMFMAHYTCSQGTCNKIVPGFLSIVFRPPNDSQTFITTDHSAWDIHTHTKKKHAGKLILCCLHSSRNST